VQDTEIKVKPLQRERGWNSQITGQPQKQQLDDQTRG